MVTAVAKIIYCSEKVSIIRATMQYASHKKREEKEGFLLTVFEEVR